MSFQIINIYFELEMIGQGNHDLFRAQELARGTPLVAQ